MTKEISAEARDIAERVETFVRDKIFAYEKDDRCEDHGPTDGLVQEMRVLAREAGVLTPHIQPQSRTAITG